MTVPLCDRLDRHNRPRGFIGHDALKLALPFRRVRLVLDEGPSCFEHGEMGMADVFRRHVGSCASAASRENPA